jgi:polysaccharide pyruvyl transferase WcaK-like protein
MTPNFKEYSNACLLGYYGGLNFGDELLLECLLHHLSKNNCKDIEILYHNTSTYDVYHQDFAYKVSERTIINTLKAFAVRKHIIVGGGGHWGMDANKNVFIMSLLLLGARVFKKKVTLLGVGYYNSTNRLGHISAWLAAKASTTIYARDGQTYKNFLRFSKKTYFWMDIAQSYVPKKNSQQRLLPALATIQDNSNISNVFIVTFRRFRPDNDSFRVYLASLELFAQNLPAKSTITILMTEPEETDKHGYAIARKLQKKYPSISLISYDYNPMILYEHFVAKPKKLRFRPIQYHMLLTALASGIKDVWSVSYDEKCSELLKSYGKNPIPITNVTAKDFATTEY